MHSSKQVIISFLCQKNTLGGTTNGLKYRLLHSHLKDGAYFSRSPNDTVAHSRFEIWWRKHPLKRKVHFSYQIKYRLSTAEEEQL